MGPVHCPHAADCYCSTFGLCSLEDCTEDACPSMYTLPQYSSEPLYWAPLPEFDNVSYVEENRELLLAYREATRTQH